MTPEAATVDATHIRGLGTGLQFLNRTLELAQTMAQGAGSCSNRSHADFCGRAARDFHTTVTRLLTHVREDELGRDTIEEAALRLAVQLDTIGY